MNALHKYLNIVLVVFLTGCFESKKNDTFKMGGRIDHEFVQKIVHRNTPNASILLSSRGGLPSQAILTAKNIELNQNDLIIEGVCFSACSEYILPVAKGIEFRKEPLVGFHWNAMMITHLYEKHAVKDLEYCTASDSQQLEMLQKNANVNSEFWRHTLRKLGKSTFYVDYKPNECPWHTSKFENRMWLPTSFQLHELYGLKFTGNVCADNFDKCKAKIDRRWKKGERIVVGDEVYISQGITH